MTVVLLSGGQDSGTLLYREATQDPNVVALHLQYGQRHDVEEACAKWLAADAGVPLDVLDLGEFIGHLAPAAPLVNPTSDTFEAVAGDENPYAADRGLPSSFVPGRNLFLIGSAAVWAAVRGHHRLVIGVCANDRAGYPDCRAMFVHSYEATISLALDLPEFTIDAPLLYLSKRDTWRMAEDLRKLPEIVVHTHTCYRGERDELHDWGYGCGRCPACTDRRDSYAEFRGAPV